MATRVKKGGAKKTATRSTRPKAPAVEVATKHTADIYEDAFADVMLTLDTLDAAGRTSVLAKVFLTMADSKKRTLEAAQDDYTMFMEFAAPVLAGATQAAGAELEPDEQKETGADKEVEKPHVSKFE